MVLNVAVSVSGPPSPNAQVDVDALVPVPHCPPTHLTKPCSSPGMAVSVIPVPSGKEAVWEPAVEMPVGLDVTMSPAPPVTVTVNVTSGGTMYSTETLVGPSTDRSQVEVVPNDAQAPPHPMKR